MTLRILHVTTIREWRGGDAQMYMLYNQLQALDGFDQWILCPSNSELAARCAADGAQHVTYARTRFKLFNAVRAIVSACRRHDIGIVHAHDSSALTACLLAMRVLPRTRLVFSRKRNNPIGNNVLSRRKYASPRIAGIVAVSDIAASVLHGVVDPRRIRTLYGAVDVEGIAALGRDGRLQRAFGIAPGTRVVGNLAGYTAQKELATFLRAAAALLRDKPADMALRFVLVGEGPQRAELEQLAHALGIAEQVVFAGYRKDAVALLAEFDVLMMSSRTEGLPIAAYEAFAAGVPVVATAAGGTREAVFHGRTGLVVEPGDWEGLARHALEVLTDPALAARLRAEALALVRTRHTREAFRDRYRDFYRDIAATA